MMTCAALLSVLLLTAGPEPPSFAEFKAQPRPADFPNAADYLRVLSRWPATAETDWHADPAHPGLAWYGGADSHWGMMELASALYAYALLAAEPDYRGTVPREALLRRVNAGVAFMTRAHVTGDLKCGDGIPWSDPRGAWHSATWAENMGAAADLAWKQLAAENRAAVQRVLVYEADRLSASAIPSGAFSDTQAESNGWDASVIARAAAMFPTHPHAAHWRKMAIEWAMNTLSAPQDATDGRRLDGRRVRDWVHTVNVHRSYAVENHGYFHTCYHWWPMWCLASAHDSYAAHGLPTPDAIYHHQRDVFGVLKTLYLGDGQFAYPSGKDWPRWLYGLTAAVPALVALADELDEPAARAMEREAFVRYEWEQLYNGDGSFTGRRLAKLKGSRGGYIPFCRFEADEAIMLGLACRLHRLHPPRPAMTRAELGRRVSGEFACPEARVVFRRDAERLAGWSWKTRTRRPQGTFALPDEPSLAEWDDNLLSTFDLSAAAAPPLQSAASQVLTDGGLYAVGRLEWAPAAPERSARRLKVADDNVPTGDIAAPEHPIFCQPHKLADLRGLVDADSITEAAADWRVLARNQRGGPSIVEARVGRGSILVCMAQTDTDFTAGKPSGALFANLVAYAKARGPVGCVPGAGHLRSAMAKLGWTPPAVSDLASADLSGFGALLVDRGSPPELKAGAWRLVQFAERGGRVVRFCLHDDQWTEDELSGGRPVGAVTHRVGFAALRDGRTAVLFERAVANRPIQPRAVRGLNWQIGNDIFNGNQRVLRSAAGEETVLGAGGVAREVELPGSWVNVDDRVGLVWSGRGRLRLIDRAERTAPFQSYAVETLQIEPAAGPAWPAGAMVLDHVVALYAGLDATGTRALAGRLVRLETGSPDLAAARVPLADGRVRTVVCNFFDQAAACQGVTVAPLAVKVLD